jgi:hypothetical protein
MALKLCTLVHHHNPNLKTGGDNCIKHFDRIMPLFSSPEPKAQGELLVSKGDAPASVNRRHASTIIFFSETAKQMYFNFGL